MMETPPSTAAEQEQSSNSSSNSRLDTQDMKSRAVSGFKALGLRSMISLLLRVVSSLALARLLFPDDLGLFGVAAFVTGLAAYFGDVGLAAGLVRQDHAPTEDETTTVFWSQQALTALIVVGMIAAMPLLMAIYNLTEASRLLLMTMTLGMFLSSLRIVPMLALERAMRFDLIARCEMIENVAQTAATIIMAALGMGAWALALGGIVRGVVGLVCIWSLSPWRPRGQFRRDVVVRLARFGIPFQLSAIVPAFMAGWLPLAVSRYLGLTSLGLITWASSIASVPMMLMSIIGKIAFPAYSRLQSDPEESGRILMASLRRLNAALSIVIPALVIFMPVIVPVVYGKRWEGAIFLVQWLLVEIHILILSTTLAQMQSASGRPGERLAVVTGFGLVRWGLGFVAVRQFGLMGVGPVLVAVSLGEAIVTAVLMRRAIPGCETILRDVFAPMVTVGVFLAVALGAGYLVAPDASLSHEVMRSLMAAVTFAALMLARELQSQSRPLWTELRATYAMLQSKPKGSGA